MKKEKDNIANNTIFKDDKFIPTNDKLCGTLLKAKKPISYLMKLTDASSFSIKKDQVSTVLYDFTNKIKTNERALILLIGEYRYVYVTENFDDDFEILIEGTTEMQFASEDNSF